MRHTDGLTGIVGYLTGSGDSADAELALAKDEEE